MPYVAGIGSEGASAAGNAGPSVQQDQQGGGVNAATKAVGTAPSRETSRDDFGQSTSSSNLSDSMLFAMAIS